MNIARIVRLRQRPRFFYGWLIVLVAFLVSMTHDVAHGQVLSVFIKPMSEEFGWGRTAMSGAYSLTFVLSGIVSVLVGPLLDRRGPRLITSVSVLLLALATMALSGVRALWQFYFFFILSRLMSGAASMGTQVAVVNWFVRQRGRAIAFSNVGMRGGLVFMPLGAQLIIASYGWRWGWIALGAGVILLVVLPAALFLRRRPEDLGLKPDGDPGDEGASSRLAAGTRRRKPEAPEPVWSLAQAVRTRSFWLLNVAMSFYIMLAAGTALHEVAFYTDVGIPPTLAVTALSLQAAAAVAGIIFWGFLAERVPARIGLMIVYWGLAAGAAYLMTVNNVAEAYTYALVFGLFQGGAVSLMGVIWADYYGRFSIGAIRGVGSLPSNIASAAGPMLAGVMFDTTGSYVMVWGIFAICMVLAMGCMFLATAPRHRAQDVAATPV